MSGILCPKCGSNQVMNDQCLKCGVIVSKYRAPGSAQGTNPVSFVASANEPRKPQEYSYTLPEAAVAHEAARRKSKQHTRMIGVGVLVIVVLVSYFTYSFFRHRASRTTGMYKNMKLIFAMKFPEPNSEWFHYDEGESDSALFQSANDAFYRGDSDNPDVAFGAWSMPGNIIPERMDPAGFEVLRPQIEEELLQRLESSKASGELTSVKPIRVGDYDGFRMECDLSVDGEPMKLIAIRGQHIGFGHWFIFAGPKSAMDAHSAEVEAMILSLDYKISVI